MRNENIGTAHIVVLEVEQIDVPDGTIAEYVGVDSNGTVVKSTSGGGGGGGLEDGDYGDVIVSGTGTVMTIDSLAVTTGKINSNAVTSGKLDTGAVTTAKIADANVTLAKLENISHNHLIGRHSSGSGVPQQLGLSDGLEVHGSNIRVANGGITQAKLSATGAGAGKVLTTDGSSMTWEEPAGGGLSDLPIGTITTRWNRNTALAMPTAFIDDMIANNNEYCSNVSHTIIESQSPNCHFTQSAINTRTAIAFDGTNWVLFNQYGAVSQRSADGSTILDNRQNFGNDSRSLTLQNTIFANYCSDFVNGKTIILNQYNRRAYYYTENHTTYYLVKAPITSGNYVELSHPFVSGNVYSFFDLTSSKRIYTTDHVTFTDCVGFSSQNFLIHRMSNGYLYTTVASTLRVSIDNGINWTSYNLPASIDTPARHSVDFDGTTYFYATQGSSATWSSTDLTSWTVRTTGLPANGKQVFFVNSLWFIFNSTSATTSFSTSTNGTTWTNRTSPNEIICISVMFVNGLYMILGTTRVITSSDGVTWTSSIAVGNTDLDPNNRYFYATGTKALFISTAGVAYFYNAGTWTTVLTTQLTTGLVNLNTPTLAGANIKVR